MPAEKRKQLNIGISQDQYEMIKTAAEQQGLTVTAFSRDAILEAAEPQAEPEPESMAQGLPAWLAAFLIFLSRSGRENRKEAA